MRPTGARARWRGRRATRRRRSTGWAAFSGSPSSETFLDLPGQGDRHRRAFPTMPWFFVWTRSPTFRPSWTSPCAAAAQDRAALMTKRWHDLAVRRPRIATGTVIGQCHRPTAASGVPGSRRGRRSERLDIHIVMDNYSTRKTKTIRLVRGVRTGMSFPPTSPHGSKVERFFADTEKQTPARRSHDRPPNWSTPTSSKNEAPKPFRWTKSADDILAAVKRFCLRVDQNLCHEL